MNPAIQNLKALSDAVSAAYANFPVAEVNDHCVRVAVNRDAEYPWHSHPDSDELFVVLKGELTIEFKADAAVTLLPGDFFTVATGKVHRTIARGRTVNLCFESSNAKTVFQSLS